MKKTEDQLTNADIVHIQKSLQILGTMNLPFTWALVKNTKKADKIAENYFDLLNDIRDKYCTLDPTVHGGYKLKKEEASKKKRLINYIDYDAGKKQEEYEKKIVEAGETACKVQFKKIDLNRKVPDKSGDEEITLGEKMDIEYVIPHSLLVPLQDHIFIDGE